MSLGGPENSLPEPVAVRLDLGEQWTTLRERVQIAGISSNTTDSVTHIVNLNALNVHVDITLQPVGDGFKAKGQGLIRYFSNGEWYFFSDSSQERHFRKDNQGYLVAVGMSSGAWAVYHLKRKSVGDRHKGLEILRKE